MDNINKNKKKWNEAIKKLEENWEYFTNKAEKESKFFNLEKNKNNNLKNKIKYKYYKNPVLLKSPFYLTISLILLSILLNLTPIPMAITNTILTINYILIPLSIYYSIEVYNYISNKKLTNNYEKYFIIILSFMFIGVVIYYIYYNIKDFEAKKEFFKIVGE